MFSTKDMLDYMTEINRLFPGTSENALQSPNTLHSGNYLAQSPFNLTMGNQSSSSADSTSPESFPSLPEMSGRQFRPTYTPDFQPAFDTPYQPRRQRPIMGRKIMSNPDYGVHDNRPLRNPQMSSASPIKVAPNDVDLRSLWQQEMTVQQQTPPNSTRIDIDQKGYGQNVFYELFPAENRDFEFKTPDKKVSPMQSSRFSSANISPSSGLSMSPVSPVPHRFLTPSPQIRRNFLSAPPRFNEDAGKMCSFCRKNGETPHVYMTHTVKERIGHRNVVTCPILRSHVCATCQATGDDAHTITYCPVLRSNNNGLPLQSTTITLKNTRVKSNGRKRY